MEERDRALVKAGLDYVAKKLDGKKSYAGAVGKMLVGVGTMISGVVGIIGNMWPDLGFPAMSYEAAIGLIGAGFYGISSGLQGIGLRHVAEKNKR